MQVKLNLIAAAAVMILAGTASAQDMVVKIGHVGPTSGSIAHLGKDNENGARMAIDELNAKGVVIGGKKAKFELLAEDDAGDPKQGTAVANKLVDAKVNGVIGHLNSGTTIPASKIYSDAGIPQISPSATNPKYTRQGFKTAFRVVADDVQLGGTLGRYAVKELKGKSIAVIDNRTAYGQGVAEEFVKGAKAAGGNLVDNQYTSDKATDFTAILTANNITGCTFSGIQMFINGNSTAKLDFKQNTTTGNQAGNGFALSSANQANLGAKFTNNTSDVFALGQFNSSVFQVEQLNTFTSANTGTLTQLGTISNAAAGSLGIP